MTKRDAASLFFCLVALFVIFTRGHANTDSKQKPCPICSKPKVPPTSDYRKIDWNDESVDMPLEDLQELLDEIKELRGDHDRRCGR